MYDAKNFNGPAFDPVGKKKGRSRHHKLARVRQLSRPPTSRKISQSLNGI